MIKIYLVIFILILLLYYLYNNFDHFYNNDCKICDYKNDQNNKNCINTFYSNKLFDGDLTANMKYLSKANKYKCIDEGENEIQIDDTNESGVAGKQNSDCQYIDEDDGTISIHNCKDNSNIYILDYTKNHIINGIGRNPMIKMYSKLILRGSEELWTITDGFKNKIKLTLNNNIASPKTQPNTDDCNYTYLNNVDDLKFNQPYDNALSDSVAKVAESDKPYWFEHIYKKTEDTSINMEFNTEDINNCLIKCNNNDNCNLVKYNSKKKECDFFMSNINNTNTDNKEYTIVDKETTNNPIIITSNIYKNNKNEFINIKVSNIETILFVNFYPKIYDKFKQCNINTSEPPCTKNTNCIWVNDKCILKNPTIPTIPSVAKFARIPIINFLK